MKPMSLTDEQMSRWAEHLTIVGTEREMDVGETILRLRARVRELEATLREKMDELACYVRIPKGVSGSGSIMAAVEERDELKARVAVLDESVSGLLSGKVAQSRIIADLRAQLAAKRSEKESDVHEE